MQRLGLTQAAYAAAGIVLPRTAQTQYGTRRQRGQTEMVDVSHTCAVVRVEPYDWSDYLGASRPAI